MLSKYTLDDCRKLRECVIQDMKDMTDNDYGNYLFLSGGMDSITALYGLMAAEIPFTVVNFKLKGIKSTDRASVEALQKQAGFECIYIDIETNEEYIKSRLPDCIKLCKQIYGKVRKTKVETIYMLTEAKKQIPKKSNVIFSIGDNICGYHKKDALDVIKYGDEYPPLLEKRISADPSVFEMNHIFVEPDYKCHTLYGNDHAANFLINFEIGAINRRFPKSMPYYAFQDYHERYHSYRRPIGFHKASGEVELFESLAKKNGYTSALVWFNRIGKEMKL